MREEGALTAAAQELGERLWYARSVTTMDADDARLPGAIAKKRAELRGELEVKYGVESLWPLDGYQWGYLEGRLAAVRWALGDEWGNVET